MNLEKMTAAIIMLATKATMRIAPTVLDLRHNAQTRIIIMTELYPGQGDNTGETFGTKLTHVLQ